MDEVSANIAALLVTAAASENMPAKICQMSCPVKEFNYKSIFVITQPDLGPDHVAEAEAEAFIFRCLSFVLFRSV